MFATAARNASISPFFVMEIVKAAARLEAEGRSIIHMSIGEPDFSPPESVQEAAHAAISAGTTGYTPALGLDELRERIAEHYLRAFRVEIDARRIAVTAGASGALLLAMAAVLERDAEVLMPDPSYPCNRHFVTAFEGRAKLVPCGPEARFQFTEQAVRRAWGTQTAGVMLASPSNPTGTSIAPAMLDSVLAAVHELSGFCVVDEIYQGLSYDDPPVTALAFTDQALVINSFSKFFNMTGWRLGWLVVPDPLVATIEKLAQNLFICASTVSQRAALACFSPQALSVYEDRRREFQRRRDFLVPALRRIGLDIPVAPDSAFYVYVDVSRFSKNSWDFAFDLLRESGVCVVPGRDFGAHAPERYVRVSYATALPKLEEAVERIERFIGALSRSAA
jgi:aspartate/methionine/tyrosine aminotransferase